MKTDRKGRSRGVGSFTLLTHHLQDSLAWRTLSPQGRAVYLEVARIYNGHNNGFLGLGVRRAADLANVNKDTAGRCFKDLLGRGLIAVGTPSSFATNNRLACEWRLTAFKCDRTHQPATKEFQSWKPETANPSPSISDRPSPRFGQSPPVRLVTVPRFRTVGAA